MQNQTLKPTQVSFAIKRQNSDKLEHVLIKLSGTDPVHFVR